MGVVDDSLPIDSECATVLSKSSGAMIFWPGYGTPCFVPWAIACAKSPSSSIVDVERHLHVFEPGIALSFTVPVWWKPDKLFL